MKEYKIYVVPALFLLLAIGSILILKPFFISLLAGSVLAIIFYPIYAKLLSWNVSPIISASIICTVLLLAVVLPSSAIISLVLQDINEISSNIDFQDIQNSAQDFIDTIPYMSTINIEDITSQTLSFLKNQLTTQAKQVPSIILTSAFSLFFLFFLLIDGKKLISFFFRTIPFTQEQITLFEKRVTQLTRAVAYGQVITALAQGLIAVIGFWLFDIPSAYLWGLITVFFAFIPLIGASGAWIPAVIYLLIEQNFISAIGLTVYGIFIISLIDNILRPFLISEQTKLHPAIIIIGVFGGLLLFGFIGVFAGPIILILFIEWFEIFLLETDEQSKQPNKLIRYK
jgi:predicted PurR-regulated permease PerM